MGIVIKKRVDKTDVRPLKEKAKNTARASDMRRLKNIGRNQPVGARSKEFAQRTWRLDATRRCTTIRKQ